MIIVFLSFMLPFSESNEKNTRNETNRFFFSEESNRNHQNLYSYKKEKIYHYHNNNEKSTFFFLHKKKQQEVKYDFFLSFCNYCENNIYLEREGERRRELNV